MRLQRVNPGQGGAVWEHPGWAGLSAAGEPRGNGGPAGPGGGRAVPGQEPAIQNIPGRAVAREQVLYEGVMEALGYRNNQQPFVRLASLAPYAAPGAGSRKAFPPRIWLQLWRAG